MESEPFIFNTLADWVGCASNTGNLKGDLHRLNIRKHTETLCGLDMDFLKKKFIVPWYFMKVEFDGIKNYNDKRCQQCQKIIADEYKKSRTFKGTAFLIYNLIV